VASPTLRSRIESVLFVASEPVSEKELVSVTGASPQDVRSALAELRTAHRESGMTLREVGGGYRLTSNPDCRTDVERFLLPPRTSMSAASLETLAIVAYLQPVTRAEIESIRGVNVDGVMYTLEQRRFVKELGRKDVVGRPIIYGTTEFFLEAFGLKSLEELPPLPEGAPRRVEGRVIALPLGEQRTASMDQIHESVEGHEDEVTAHGDAKLTESVADALEHAMQEPA
jgi:segregation and condensation protein B